jgi:antitoxin ParD1/3/4
LICGEAPAFWELAEVAGKWVWIHIEGKRPITGFDSFLLFVVCFQRSEFCAVSIMNISLTPELAKFVEKEVESGLYQTASEVIRAGLRRLKEDQAVRLPQAPKTLEELEAQLLQSIDHLDCGESVDGEEVFRLLRKRIKESRSDA